MSAAGRESGSRGGGFAGRKLMTAIVALVAASPAWPGPPILYSARELQSPVHAGPGDLLLLAGADLAIDDEIVLRADSGQMVSGLEVIRPASDQKALTVRLPEQLAANRVYSLTVANGGRSSEVRINDARPGWFIPGSLPESGAPPGLAREIKIIGRNLAPAGIAATLVRLRGPRDLTMAGHPASLSAPELDDFVTRVTVPELPRGDYSVALSRDGIHWVGMPGALRIEAARAEKIALAADAPAFGGCRPDDARDDTSCIVAAIAAAQRRGGGTVRFGAGVWQLDDPGAAGVSAAEGIVVPAGVNLAGNATRTARLARGAGWRRSRAAATFTLLGDNVVSDLEMSDDTKWREPRDDPAFLQVGRTWYRADRDPAGTSAANDDIVITHNLFAGSAVSISSGTLPTKRLVITHNTFRAFRLALAFGGDANNDRDTFRVEDSVIACNVFEPGSYLDAAIGQGTRATEFGAGERVDFSENVANGAAVAGLDSPTDARGWRAAFFWHLLGPQERLLISDNEVSCSGDKAGDGEAIALDNNHNSFAFDDVRDVLEADAGSVTVLGPVSARQAKHAVDVKSFYVGHWLQIADGRGVGQSRRIVAVEYDAVSRRTTFRIAPAWDVAPVPRDSRVVVGRTFWQAFIVANRIDHRAPLCRKSNRTAPRGGGISLWAQSSDSVIAFNRQFDTNGISFQQLSTQGATNFQSFLEIRGNVIRGEYAAGQNDSRQGIQGSHGASPEQPPPIASYGVFITGNAITAADNARGPAISLPATWYRGPAPHDWTLIDRMLIYKNEIHGGQTGIDIGSDTLARRTVLLFNRCTGVARPMRAGAPQVIPLCPARTRGDCECAGLD